MNATRFSHAACAHPSTKVARAACRRAMQKAASASTPSFVNPILAAVDAALNGPKMILPAPIVKEMTIVGGDVTKNTWREAKGEISTVVFTGHTLKGEITGWSAKNIQIKVNGKTKRFPAEQVVSAYWGK